MKTIATTESLKLLLSNSNMNISQELMNFVWPLKGEVAKLMWDGDNHQPYWVFSEDNIEIQYEGSIYDPSYTYHSELLKNPSFARDHTPFIVPTNTRIYLNEYDHQYSFNPNYDISLNAGELILNNFTFTKAPYQTQSKMDMHIDFSGQSTNNGCISILATFDLLTNEPVNKKDIDI